MVRLMGVVCLAVLGVLPKSDHQADSVPNPGTDEGQRGGLVPEAIPAGGIEGNEAQLEEDLDTTYNWLWYIVKKPNGSISAFAGYDDGVVNPDMPIRSCESQRKLINGTTCHSVLFHADLAAVLTIRLAGAKDDGDTARVTVTAHCFTHRTSDGCPDETPPCPPHNSRRLGRVRIVATAMQEPGVGATRTARVVVTSSDTVAAAPPFVDVGTLTFDADNKVTTTLNYGFAIQQKRCMKVGATNLWIGGAHVEIKANDVETTGISMRPRGWSVINFGTPSSFTYGVTCTTEGVESKWP